jgi:polysaccharide export outer membrane protein
MRLGGDGEYCEMRKSHIFNIIRLFFIVIASGLLFFTIASCSGKVAHFTPDVKPDDGIEQVYLMGPEDVLEIIVWKNQTLSKVVTVRPDGKVSLPLIGDLQATGITPIQLRDEISERLTPYYREPPEVSVIVQQVNSHFYILGEVQRPGRYVVKSGTKIIQAIALAGGFTPFASTNNIVLLRNGAESNNGHHESAIKIPYRDIISGKNLQANLPLRTGDTIIVP